MYSRRVQSAAGWSRAVVLVLLMTSAAVVSAQVELGDAKLNLNGNLGFTYGGAFGTDALGHGMSLIGNADLTGYYYHPNFLNFSFQPTYGRSQSNADTALVSNDQSYTAGVNFFSGSRFPGGVSYSKTYSSFGQYGTPGGSLLSSDGSGQSFGINWGAYIPDWPTLRASFTRYGSSNSVFGTTEESSSNLSDFNLSSNYLFSGWNFSGMYDHINQAIRLPNFLSPEFSHTEGSSTSYSATAAHSLPFHGSFGAGWTHSLYGDGGRDSSGNNLYASAGISPTAKLGISSSVRYDTNALGTLEQSIFGNLRPVSVEVNSKSLSFDNVASYSIGRGLAIQGFVSHREQYFDHTTLSDTQYGGGLGYSNSHRFLGIFHFGVRMTDTISNERSNNGFGGLIFDANYSRRIGSWDLSGDFSYTQSMQTQVGFTTTSGYTYGSSFQKRFSPGKMWYGSFRGSHSALTQIEGSSNGSLTYSTGILLGRYSFSGNYSQSSGTSFVSSNGIVTPNPLIPVLTRNTIWFDGRGYGVTGSMVLKRGLTIVAGYGDNRSDSFADPIRSINQTNRYYGRARYQVRKLTFGATYRRFEQGISAFNSRPTETNDYYFEITRWFNVF